MRQAIFIFVVVAVIGILTWTLCFSRAATPLPIPALTAQWHDQVYGLDNEEAIRFIAPPFPAQRASLVVAAGQVLGQTLHVVRPSGLVDPIAWTSKTGTVGSALAQCIDKPTHDLHVQPDAAAVVVNGDWIFREQAPSQRRMQALAQIIPLVTAGKTQITNHAIPVYVVLVQGSWSPPGKTELGPEPLHLGQSITHEPPEVMRGPPPDFFQFLALHCGCRFADQTTNPPPTLSWLDQTPGGMLGTLQRRALFRTLESQTSLTFTETRQEIPIWNVRMTGPTTRAGANQ